MADGEAVFRPGILQRRAKKGGMLPPQGIVHSLAGKAVGFQGKERAERCHRLFPEAVDPLQFGEREDVPGQAAVLLQRRDLVRRQEAAFQHPGTGSAVQGQGMVPVGFQLVEEPVVEFFGAVRPGQVLGRADGFVALGGGREGGQQRQKQHKSSLHMPKLGISGES